MADHAVPVRTFSMSDQEFFARVSADYNPLHLSVLVARRTQAGAPVVHGVHAVLWVLDVLARQGLAISDLTSLKVQFSKFVYIDQPVTIRIVCQDSASAKVELDGDIPSLMTFILRFGHRKKAEDAKPVAGGAIIIPGSVPIERSFAELGDLSGSLKSPNEMNTELCAAFPVASKALGGARIAALAQTSTLVGMVCPGRHSIFSSLAVDFVDGLVGEGEIAFRVAKTDKRFSMITMAVAGSGITGDVLAFVRRAPSAPATVAQCNTKIRKGEFSAVSALIVGGSRGLGAATASLIAAGGGRVTVTYAQGRDEALAICRNINAACGEDVADAVRLDVRMDFAEQAKDWKCEFTQLYYFATSQIFRQKSTSFSEASFQEFYSIYVERFYRLCCYVAETCAADFLPVFYPSSEAVTIRPKGLTEYAMAKAAGELLCADMGNFLPKIRVHSHRIPRTTTDQTLTLTAVPAEDPLDVMLPQIRALQQLR